MFGFSVIYNEHCTENCGYNAIQYLCEVIPYPDKCQDKNDSPGDRPKQTRFHLSHSLDSPNKKSAEHPVISQMISTHSGATFQVFPLHNLVILTCCTDSFPVGHNRAAMSFFNTFLPLALALAIASSNRIIILSLIYKLAHNRGRNRCNNQFHNQGAHPIIPMAHRGPLSRHIPTSLRIWDRVGNLLCLSVSYSLIFSGNCSGALFRQNYYLKLNFQNNLHNFLFAVYFRFASLERDIQEIYPLLDISLDLPVRNKKERASVPSLQQKYNKETKYPENFTTVRYCLNQISTKRQIAGFLPQSTPWSDPGQK